MNKKTITEELAMGSIVTGQISEVHITNMKLYPFIFIDDLNEAEISYSIVTDPSSAVPGKKSTVSYSLSFNAKPDLQQLNAGKDNLQKALSVLFSQDVFVILRDKFGQDLLEKYE